MTQSEKMTLEYLYSTVQNQYKLDVKHYNDSEIKRIIKRLKMVLVARKGGK